MSFKNIGNDGIDFSGSKAEIKNINFNVVGDKLVSIGEKSNIIITDISASNSFVGIACKDGSSVEIENIKFDKVDIPLVAYNKKPAYQSGKIFVKNEPSIKEFEKKWISDQNSKIIFNDKDQSIKSKRKKILTIIYEKDINALRNLEKI